MGDYQLFLQGKQMKAQSVGIDTTVSDVNPQLKDFQKAIVTWACKKGRSAVFADTGLGKTFMSLEWARLMDQNTLFVAPLSVARQTVREAQKIDLDVRYVRDGADVDSAHKMHITNYEMLKNFDPAAFGAVVLDESSILKAIDGKTRQILTGMFSDTPYRLACTATPAPNDLVEIGNHSEFLGVNTANEMKSMFFINANKESYQEFGGVRLRKKMGNDSGQEWRLRHHAEEKFYRWMSTWAMSVRRPSDLGYSDNGYVLPELKIIPDLLDYSYVPKGKIAFTGFTGVSDYLAFLRHTSEIRCKAGARKVNADDNEQWIVWTHLNPDSKFVTSLIPGAVEIEGSEHPEAKAQKIEDFQDGKYRVMVTKPDIAGFGMNFQNAARQYWVSINHSWEQWYQAIRRSYRFLQNRPVEVHVALLPQMQEVWDSIIAKEQMATAMSESLIAQVRSFELEELAGIQPIAEQQCNGRYVMRIPQWLKAA